mmetsp:Transcript_1796/g.5501  ORF Transcript_1796/g.5501 Transcript_1796/m.5501 type:complete len:93 (+) Transcript_1796:1190-1468(+)
MGVVSGTNSTAAAAGLVSPAIFVESRCNMETAALYAAAFWQSWNTKHLGFWGQSDAAPAPGIRLVGAGGGHAMGTLHPESRRTAEKCNGFAG